MNQFWHARCGLSHEGYQQRTLLYQNPDILSKRLPKGFSLFEVLVSLLLLTSISLAVLKQQWQSNAFFTSFIHNVDNLLNSDNQHENRLITQ